MPHKDDVAAPRSSDRWTTPNDYMASLARRRTARRAREATTRTQPESPRFTLSTLPFLALIVGLGVIMVAIFIAAWPGGSQPKRSAAATPEQQEVGTARKGWYQDAEREFRS